jgi:hypothetical protein
VPLKNQDPANPFNRLGPYKLQLDLAPAAPSLDGAIVRNLFSMWSRIVPARRRGPTVVSRRSFLSSAVLRRSPPPVAPPDRRRPRRAASRGGLGERAQGAELALARIGRARTLRRSSPGELVEDDPKT